MEKEPAKEEDGLLSNLELKSFPTPDLLQNRKKHKNLCILLASNESKNNDLFAFKSTPVLLSVYTVPGYVPSVPSPHSSPVVWVAG